MDTGIRIKIIYEDKHILVCVKPPGLLSMADKSGDDDILSLLKRTIKERDKKVKNVYLGLVQRLDRPVSGIMVFAKRSKAAGRLSEQIRKRHFNKKYLAVVHGIPSERTTILKNNLIWDENNKIALLNNGSSGKEATLEYMIIESKQNLSLLAIDLQTGRHHQVRAQLASIGHPIVGDKKYGINNNKRFNIALFCREISFLHPATGEKMTFSLLPRSVYPWDLFDYLTYNWHSTLY